MPFGLDGFRGARRIEASSASRELLPLAALTAEAASAIAIMTDVTGLQRTARFIAYAELLSEIARRSGQVEMLARAASAAHRARREAGADEGLQVAAAYELAQTQYLAFTLFADTEAADEVRAHSEAALALHPPALLSTRLKALMNRLKGALALASNDQAAALEAAEALEVAAKVMIALKAPLDEVAALTLDRADLLIGLGNLCHDRVALRAAQTELAALSARLDPDLQPISWTRTETLRGQALVGLGEVLGDPALIAEAVAALKSAVAALPTGHSPLDEARAGHALGLALQAMGEACEEEILFDRAVKAFAPAIAALERIPALPYRAVVTHDSAVCLARRAERRGDLFALEQAEATFRETLKARNAAADPLSWAVTQVALARIYEAQSALRPDTGERADAAFALASALDVFTERGLRTLSAAALVSLERMRERV